MTHIVVYTPYPKRLPRKQKAEASDSADAAATPAPTIVTTTSEKQAQVSTTKNTALLKAVQERLRVGESQADAARALGISSGVVQGLVRRHGKDMPSAPPEYVLHAPRPGGCCWPLSAGRPWRFCVEPRLPGRLYCARHQRIAFNGRAGGPLASPRQR